MAIKTNKAQVTIFIIIAIVLVAGVITIYLLTPSLTQSSIPKDIEPVYSYYQSCIESETQIGAFILGQKSGYIENPEFSPGSEFMPFSSELDFLGTGVPYWYYISGNNIKREQIPSKEKMQEQLSTYLEQRIQDCNFQKFQEKGFAIILEEPTIKTKINPTTIETQVNQKLTISFENTTWSKKSHTTKTTTQLGEFYNIAKKIYENNKETMFLENQALDILRLNAPVDGSEIGCATKIWQVQSIRQNLTTALETNIPFTKIKGDYYTLSNPNNKYFIQDINQDISTNINFMFSTQWPVKVEVWPSEENILRADPIGLQQGLGILGFCYTPYHFIYDFAYPVLIQIYSNNEMFQFPVVISIDKNTQREAESTQALPNVIPELCQHKNTELTVSTFNTNLEPIKTNIQFKCFDTACPIGETTDGTLTTNFPQCANGFIIASAEGYETKKQIQSTITPTSTDIILDKEYELEIEILKDNQQLSDAYAVITLTNQRTNKATTIAYPEQSTITLTEGQYKIQSYIYSDSTIKFPATKSEKCTDIPKSGIFSLFGVTEKKCFTIEIPEQVTSFAVSGGGTQQHPISEANLKQSTKLTINSQAFTTPTTPEQLQENYNSIEISSMEVTLQ